MHTAALFAANGRGPAGPARPGPGAAARAGKHWSDVTWMARHCCGFALLELGKMRSARPVLFSISSLECSWAVLSSLEVCAQNNCRKLNSVWRSKAVTLLISFGAYGHVAAAGYDRFARPGVGFFGMISSCYPGHPWQWYQQGCWKPNRRPRP